MPKALDEFKTKIINVFQSDPNISDIDFDTIKAWAKKIGKQDPFSAKIDELDDEKWLEQVISYAASKPANEWNDKDYQEASLAIEEMVTPARSQSMTLSGLMFHPKPHHLFNSRAVLTPKEANWKRACSMQRRVRRIDPVEAAHVVFELKFKKSTNCPSSGVTAASTHTGFSFFPKRTVYESC